mgnify:CR=1 FL=1|tara:strand:- start:1315 stop:2157 length:843 start_codon:yes stop_codon:yes gene_type:complete
MKNLNTPLGLFALAYLIYGVLMNIRMFTEEMWPTSIFFISMGIGLLFLLLNTLTKRLPKFRLWQIIIGLLPVAAFFLHMKIKNQSNPIEIVESSTGKEKILYQNGDIIFQTSKSSQSKAIQLATQSKYSHMGIIYENDGKYFVYEAVHPVKLTPLAEWINRGKNGHYVIKRLFNADQVLTGSTLLKMKQFGEQFKGKTYDIYFEWSDDKIYCSELVWKIYKQAVDIEIGQLEQLADFDLSNAIVKAKMKERYGDNIPMDEKVISPAAMFNSEKLITVVKK